MYKHCDLDDSYISLHDCRAEKMKFQDGILSFGFPEGFWVTEKHSQNHSDTTVRTNSSQVDFQIIDEEIDGIEIYLFKKNRKKIVRDDWEPMNFINAVNAGDFQVEFITQYKGYQSYLFKCMIWFDVKPYHAECEIILRSENALYCWNELRYDRAW